MNEWLTTLSKLIIIIAGPNGAGKTTFAKDFLPNDAACPIFINADLIAKGLSPFLSGHADFRAGRVMLEEIHRNIQQGNSFAFETTLSGRSYAKLIPQWQQQGYYVKLFFLQLDSIDLAISRVTSRVEEGGHGITESVIKRRFYNGMDNFEQLYKYLVDEWLIYNNSGKYPQFQTQGVNR